MRDEPHDSQASKKPLRKQIKKALEQMTAQQMEAESEQPAMCITGAIAADSGTADASHTACISHINGVALACGRGFLYMESGPKRFAAALQASVSGSVHHCLWLCAGRQICSRVLAQPLFEHARRLGLFMHCARLQEVNPEPLVQATLAAGAPVYSAAVAFREP